MLKRRTFATNYVICDVVLYHSLRPYSLNPVYSAQENNTYILSCSAKELFGKGGVEFKVKDWDRIGKNDELGSVVVSGETLYTFVSEQEGVLQELKLDPPKGKGEAAGFLSVKFRAPTLGDREDMKKAASLVGKIRRQKEPLQVRSMRFSPSGEGNRRC